jgi:biopolymer transport protein ExbD
MGDIAFLLIIFFLLASNFNVDRPMDLTLPRSGQVKDIEAEVAAHVDIDVDGKLYLDGEEVNDADEIGIGIKAILQGETEASKRHVQLRCDADLTLDVYEPVIRAIVEANGVIEAVGEAE